MANCWNCDNEAMTYALVNGNVEEVCEVDAGMLARQYVRNEIDDPHRLPGPMLEVIGHIQKAIPVVLEEYGVASPPRKKSDWLRQLEPSEDEYTLIPQWVLDGHASDANVRAALLASARSIGFLVSIRKFDGRFHIRRRLAEEDTG